MEVHGSKKLKILICGLPGSGKTTLANVLVPMLNAVWLNADEVRKNANDWDFSPEGRIRQANRMKSMAQEAIKDNRHVIADFVCPTETTRRDFDADFTIWMDTTKGSLYKDTLKMFEPPKKTDVDYHVAQWFDDTHAQLAEVVKNWTKKRNRRNHENK